MKQPLLELPRVEALRRRVSAGRGWMGAAPIQGQAAAAWDELGPRRMVQASCVCDFGQTSKPHYNVIGLLC